jgi:acetoin utilization deacetylase AcuC-like enzyme
VIVTRKIADPRLARQIAQGPSAMMMAPAEIAPARRRSINRCGPSLRPMGVSWPMTGAGHPERPERFDAVARAIDPAGMLRLTARAATDDELADCHTREYIALARREIQAGMRELSTGDTSVSPKSLDVALRAAGGVLNAVDAVFAGKANNAFCCVRPPGHHATPSRGMGFCVFNNVAVAARYAQKRHQAERVLIADWDVHHGNGTQDIFYSDPTVFFFSTHQSPWYPGAGAAEETEEKAPP